MFQALSDHEWFLKGPNLNCQLVKYGREQKNGQGAIRKVVVTRSIFTEKITAFSPVEHYEYKIQSLIDARGRSIPLRHERGWLDFSAENDGTRVDWHSRYEFSLPIVGNAVEVIVSWRAKKVFASLLQRAKSELEINSIIKLK
ncbi:SRPBCC family protein [Acaryochloris marina]|uniref:SRPBCC family protein n=1 Tax=Acaryochloris marina TaxID=155978 RepID=UPI0021C277BB|nr:SRPBCC family protein [Acaryochloris marina]